MQELTFQKSIDWLCDAFGKEVSPKTLQVYWDFLNEIDDTEFKSITKQIIRKERFFPAISVFLEYTNKPFRPDGSSREVAF